MTNEEIEQVRQLRREIALVTRMADWYMREANYALIPPFDPHNTSYVRNESTSRRAIQRLEAILAEKTAGMKPEATA